MTRLVTPEVTGVGTARLDLSGSEAVRLQPSPNLGERANDLQDDPQLSSSAAVNVKNSLGFSDFMDIEVSWGHEQAAMLALKFQFIGAPTKSAGAGNFSLGMRVGYGLIVSGGSLESDEIIGNESRRSYILESGHGLVDLMVGYRVLGSLLVYGGYFLDDGRYNLKFKTGVRNTFINEISNKGFSFGTQWQANNLLVNLSLAKGEFTIEGKNERISAIDGALSLGFLY